MRIVLICFLFLASVKFGSVQSESSFQAGEWLKFKLSYSGWVKAGNATLHIKNATYNGLPVYRVVGKYYEYSCRNAWLKISIGQMNLPLYRQKIYKIDLF